jgi:hypothetical protein
MFATLATTLWSRIRRAAGLVRAFALLEDRPSAAPPSACASPEQRLDTWPSRPAGGASRRGSPPAGGRPASGTVVDQRAFDHGAGRSHGPATSASALISAPGASARAAAAAASAIAVEPSRAPHPHPHRRRVVSQRSGRRPGTPSAVPMVCLSPIVRRAGPGDDRRR